MADVHHHHRLHSLEHRGLAAQDVLERGSPVGGHGGQRRLLHQEAAGRAGRAPAVLARLEPRGEGHHLLVRRHRCVQAPAACWRGYLEASARGPPPRPGPPQGLGCLVGRGGAGGRAHAGDGRRRDARRPRKPLLTDQVLESDFRTARAQERIPGSERSRRRSGLHPVAPGAPLQPTRLQRAAAEALRGGRRVLSRRGSRRGARRLPMPRS
mmetsp:Transcript_101446/g.262749  ORF Transcript_101446/g.262749 Transcript_101446/m.262749 type:complete len:211 (+) Transcript_101446:2038-2670(+)